MMTLRNIDRAGLEARLRWSAYRGLRLLGAPGVIVVALLLAALGAELALVRPMLAQQRQALARIASQRAAQEGGGNAAATVAVAGAPRSDADAAQILALIERHGLTTHEVKYRQIAAGRLAAGNAGPASQASQATHRGRANQANEIREARVAMALPSAGSYAQFHELIAGLSAFRGVRAESFTLRRNMPTERMLAIDLDLSMPLPAADLSLTTRLHESGEGGAHAGKPVFRDLFPEQDRQRELAAALPPVPEPPPPPPQAPPLPFRLIGVWADQAQRKFILGRDGNDDGGADADSGSSRTVIACRRCGAPKTPGHIGPGDRFFDHYRLLKIEPGRLTFMYLPLSLTQTIDLDGAMRTTGK